MNAIKKILIPVWWTMVVVIELFIGWQVVDYLIPHPLSVTVLDIGQGDAILIQTPEHRTILIDGGPDRSVITALSRHLPFYNRTIDLMVLTHPDSDHSTGEIAVFERYAVSAVLYTNVDGSTSLYQAWRRALAAEGSRPIIAGTVPVIEVEPGIYLEVLYPFQSLAQTRPASTNETSIITRLTSGNFSVLLTGDTDSVIEDTLIAHHVDLRALILKVAHHGSKTSTDDRFLSAVKPSIALISVGLKNRYGHPTPEALARLQRHHIPVLLTSTWGDITVVATPGGFSLAPPRP